MITYFERSILKVESLNSRPGEDRSKRSFSRKKTDNYLIPTRFFLTLPDDLSLNINYRVCRTDAELSTFLNLHIVQ